MIQLLLKYGNKRNDITLEICKNASSSYHKIAERKYESLMWKLINTEYFTAFHSHLIPCGTKTLTKQVQLECSVGRNYSPFFLKNVQIYCKPCVTQFFVTVTAEAANMTPRHFRFGTLPARNVSGASRMPTTGTPTVGLMMTVNVPSRCHSLFILTLINLMSPTSVTLMTLSDTCVTSPYVSQWQIKVTKRQVLFGLTF